MVGIVKSLEGVLKGDDLEKMAETMDKFEQQFETLDVQSVRRPAPPSPSSAPSGPGNTQRTSNGSTAQEVLATVRRRFGASCAAACAARPVFQIGRSCARRRASAQLKNGAAPVGGGMQGIVEAVMNQQAALSTPEDEVNSLLQQVMPVLADGPPAWLVSVPSAGSARLSRDREKDFVGALFQPPAHAHTWPSGA